MKPIIIALHGPPRSGKNEFVLLAQKELPFLDHFSLSSRIKEVAHKVMGAVFPESLKEAQLPSLNSRSPRDLYIHAGNFDTFDPGLWAKHTSKEILASNLPSEGIVAVIESVGKQPQWNELIQNLSAQFTLVLVEISRPGYSYTDNRSPIVDNRENFHLLNNGSVEDFQKLVKELLNRVSSLDIDRNGVSTVVDLPDMMRPHQPTIIR